MSAYRTLSLTSATALLTLLLGDSTGGQVPAVSSMPANAPTDRRAATPAASLPAPIAATAGTATTAAPAPHSDRAGGRSHPAQVTCAGDQLEVHAQNSSLNGILRAIAQCNGMRISGGVSEQRVFGNYGPATPATVLATLIGGTGSNMVLRESVTDAPAELTLTPRTGGATPPSPASYTDADNVDDEMQPTPARQFSAQQPTRTMPVVPGSPADLRSGNQTPVPPPLTGSPVTGPRSIPQPINNVNGSPLNSSPTAGSYPTANSVPLDSIATPSTTPATSGIVDSPNPPPAGSDTSAALNGAPAGTPGTTNINPGPTGQTSTPGASNTTILAPANQQTAPSQLPADLTPEQIFQQLQERQQRQQQQQQQQNNPQPQ